MATNMPQLVLMTYLVILVAAYDPRFAPLPSGYVSLDTPKAAARMVDDQPFATKTDSAPLCLSTLCAATTVPTSNYIAARGTTTGSACPAGITIGPGDDEGDFPQGILLSDIGVTQTFTSPESVLLTGSTYTVTSGSIILSNSAVIIPSVTTSSVFTLIGLPAILMPGYTGVSMSITRTDWVRVVSGVSTAAA